MAEKIVSPGVFTREKDLTFVPQGVAEIGAAVVAPFPKGPAFVPTVVESQADLQAIFGIPDGVHYGQYTAQDYLRENGRVTCVRVAGLGGYTQQNALALKVTISGSTKTVAVLSSTSQDSGNTGFAASSLIQDTGTSYAASDTAQLTLSGSAVSGTDYSLSFDPTHTDYIKNVFGQDALGPKGAYNLLLFENELTSYTGSAAPSITSSVAVLGDIDFTFDTSVATTPYVLSQKISNARYNLFRFHTLGFGNAANRQVNVFIDTVRVAGSVVGSDYGSFNVTVREFGDSDTKPIVLETFEGVNLDPDSTNYIARVIGNRNVTSNSDGTLSETGDYLNSSKYVRVEVAASTSYPVTSVPAGTAAYALPVNESTLPVLSYSTASMDDPYSKYSGFKFDFTDNLNYLNPTPQTAAYGNNVSFSLDENLGANGLGLELTGSTQTSTDLKKRKFGVAFQGGFDGFAPNVAKNVGSSITAANTVGLNCSTSLTSGSVAYTRALNAVSNADEFDINLLVTPGVIRSLHPTVTSKAIEVVTARADCFYIADLTGHSATVSTAIQQAEQVNSNYVGCYYPWVKINDVNTGKVTAVPPSVVMAGVFAANDKNGSEWSAPAGLNRGGITSAVSVVKRLTHTDRDELYTGKVNPIATFPGQGIVAFGQKTLQNKSSALDRISVRRLLIALKKFIASTSRYLIFEQNTTATRRRFLSVVNPYLDQVQARQGIFAFRVVMDETNNTPDVIDRNLLKGQIFVQPTRTAEFIVLDFNVLPTGATFDV